MMLMQKFEEWKIAKDLIGCEIDEDLFSVFYQEISAGKTFMEMLCLLAYQMYEVQICMEGLIEETHG